MTNKVFHICFPLLALLATAGASAAPVHYDLSVVVDAGDRKIEVRCRAEGMQTGAPPVLRLAPDAEIAALSVNDTPHQPFQPRPDGTLVLPDGTHAFEISYRYDVANDWPYLMLGPGDAWYPEPAGTLLTFDLEVRVPAGWATLSQAVPAGNEDGVRRWSMRDPQQGIHLVAGPWSEYRRERGGHRAAALLLDDDRALAGRYLDAALTSMNEYSRAIGDYPYHQFALVENRAQTGFGMPGFTLLGSRVIRLPFIVDTSFPHEVLHNWWGNGVFPDYARGNWSEALTTYLSDHRFREREGTGGAYRRDMLISWQDFAAEGRDFPLTEFRARHDRATQAVGYGKGLFVFHMLRMKLTDPVFLDGLRRLYDRHRFQVTDWRDVQSAFEAACDCGLDGHFRQWLQRTGAPRIELELREESPRKLELTLRQAGDNTWSLDVPVRITDVEGTVSTRRVELDRTERTVVVESDAPLAKVRVDPDYDVFRHLYPGERPLTFSSVFGARAVTVVTPAGNAEIRAAAAQLIASRGDWRLATDAGAPASGVRVLVGAHNRHARALFADGGPGFSVGDTVIELAGQRHPLAGASAVVLVAPDPQQPDTPVLWVAGSDSGGLVDLLGRLPHYGRVSYAVFADAGSRATATGQWETRDHPLVWRLRDAQPAREDPPAPLF